MTVNYASVMRKLSGAVKDSAGGGEVNQCVERFSDDELRFALVLSITANIALNSAIAKHMKKKTSTLSLMYIVKPCGN